MSLKSVFTGTALLGSMMLASADTGMNFMFSLKSFSTISGPSGVEYGHYSGFTITNNDGVELYTSKAPGGGSPCAAHDGTTLTLTSECLVDAITINCQADLYKEIQECSAVYANGYEYPGGINEEQNFIGISITDEAVCGAWVDTALDCTEDTPFTLEDASWPS